MCYDAEYKLRDQIKQAEHDEIPEEEIEELKRQYWILTGNPFYDPDVRNIDDWPEIDDYDYFHVSGFSNPVVCAYTSIKPTHAILGHWSFIAGAINSYEEAYSHRSPGWVRNLNVISENMFTSKVFGSSAKHRRCVIDLNAYYEHHHSKGKTYPFRIYRKDGKPLHAAAIYRKTYLEDEEGIGLEFNSIAILTCMTSDTSTMAKIHNNKAVLKRGNGHRMLVLLDDEDVHTYLRPYPFKKGEKGDKVEEKLFQQEILDVCRPYDESRLAYHTVINLKERNDSPYLGNIPEITKPFLWEKLDYEEFPEIEMDLQ